MNITQLSKKLQKLVSPVSEESFVYDLLSAYGEAKANITKLKNGTMNKSNVDGQVIRANKILFQPADSDSLFTKMTELMADQRCMRHKPRFFVVTDYESLLAYDTKREDTLDIHLDELHKHMEFFMPLAGREPYSEAQENPADVKAASKMARLYDEILRTNPDAQKDPEERHKLNVFLSRLLFCFFAEDTEIFPKDSFSKAITELTEEDGSDLDDFLNQLFEILNTENRDGCIDQLCKFPYVNGGLFGDSYDAPRMTRRTRRMIIDCGASLLWSEINPDIFGSMIQAVVDPEQRGGLGMHYTSVPNIMKVIEPLFLNDLREEFEESKEDANKLAKLLSRISRIRFFDPACGSGNFLIITYKEIRKLEMDILEERIELDGYIPLHSMITLDHFYGIEIDDFAHEVAILSLWLAEHQMNVQFKEKFGNASPTLPLREAGSIVAGNATLLNWNNVCQLENKAEAYVMGNPPYLGATMQGKAQKEEIQKIFNKYNKAKKIDYIACWFVKGAEYIKNKNAKFGFVSTNSICQGEQVAMLWPIILQMKLEIAFAHTSFKWTNSAKGNAGVICVVVGVRNKEKSNKYLFTDGIAQSVSNINPYLSAAPNAIIGRQPSAISGLPKMPRGNQPTDGGNLILSTEEKATLIANYPETERLIKKLYGSQEFIKGLDRWCLWLSDQDLDEVKNIPPIMERIIKTKEMRLNSRDSGARKLAARPHQFRETKSPIEQMLVIPRISSERRDYIPIGFLGNECIITDLLFGIYDAELFLFGLLSSRMHMSWVRAVAGRLKTDYRYSSFLCYNTYPVPPLSQKQKIIIEERSYEILDIRDEHIGKTLAQLYDPDKMPEDLREAHHQLDLAVDSCYRKKPFESDAQRLELLFKMYEKMTKKQN